MTRKKTRARLALAAVLALFAVAIVLVVQIVGSRLIARRVQAASERSGLVVTYSGVTIRLGLIVLHDVEVRPRGDRAPVAADTVLLRAPRLAIDLSFGRPVRARVLEPTLSIRGPRAGAALLGALAGLGDEGGVASERAIPVEVDRGSFVWQDPFGEGSAIVFPEASIDPSRSSSGGSDVQLVAELRRGRVAFAHGVVEPLRLRIERSRLGEERIDVTADLDADAPGPPSVRLTRGVGRDVLRVSFDRLDLGIVHLDDAVPLDLSRATLDGTVVLTRDEDGAASSHGELVLDGASVRAIDAGFAKVPIGDRARLLWIASPLHGAPGVLRVDEATLEAEIAGISATVRLDGRVAIGPEARGPWSADLGFRLEPIACPALARALGLGGPLVSIRGELAVEGTIDAKDDRGVRVDREVTRRCDVGLGIGGGP